MEYNLTFVMFIKCLLFCVLISGANTRGVPAADDDEILSRRQDEKVKSGDSSDLTNCKGCQKSRQDDESSSFKDHDRVETLENSPQQRKPPSFIKPSLSFGGFKIRVNNRRRISRKQRTRQNKQASHTTERVHIDRTIILDETTTTEPTPHNSGKDGSKNKNGEINTYKTTETSEHIKISSLKVTDTHKAITELNEEIAVKFTESQKEEKQPSKGDDGVVNSKRIGDKGKVYDKSEDTTKHDKKAGDVLDVGVEQDEDTSNVRKVIKLKDKVATGPKDVKETSETDSFIVTDIEPVNAKQVNKPDSDFSRKMDNNYKGSESETELKEKPKSGINSNPKKNTEDENSKSSKGEQKYPKKSNAQDKENFAKDGFKIRPKNRRLKVDRFQRPDLRQIPDAARLEWRLHPNVDVPVRDILQSIRNMVGFMQRSIQHVNVDFDTVRNTTRWKYMMGVRDGLTILAEENDIIYTVVLEASLLTKEIYRKAHERRHPRHSKTDMHEFVADYRQRYRDNVRMELTREERAVYIETEHAKRLVEKLKQRLQQRQFLKDEVIRVNHLVKDSLAVTALHDLERRAKQTIHVLSVSHSMQNITDRANLYVYMGRDLHDTIRNTKSLLIDSYDIITRTKSIVMANQEKVHQYEMIVQNTLRSPGTGNKIDRIVAWDRATSYARNLSDTAAFIMMNLKPLIQNANDMMTGKSKYSIEKRLDTSVSRLRDINEQLKLVYDRIIVAIDDERVVKQRCETYEGSGWYDDDEDGVADVLIDCEPYIIVIEASGDGGDDLEGSGEGDGLHIDVYLPEGDGSDVGGNATEDNMDIDINKVPIIPNTGDVIFIDDNEDTLEVVPITDVPTVSPITDESVEVPATDKPVEVSVTNEPTVEPKTKKSTTLSPDSTTATTLSSESKPTSTTTSKSKPLPTNKATTPSPEKSTPKTSKTTTQKTAKPKTTTLKTTTTPKSTTTPKTTTTTTTVPTTTTTTETVVKKTTKAVSEWFGGWFNDAPDSDNINIDLDIDGDLLQVDNLLNSLIRQRLSNYSIESKALMERSQKVASKQNEISLTWMKVQNRFQKYENATRKASTFVSKWKAEKQVFIAVHDEVEAADTNVQLKADVVDAQSEAAIKKAELKLKSMKRVLSTQREKEKTAADPVEFKQAIEKVSMATENIKELRRLKQLYPNPCPSLQIVDNSIKSNITELRTKIAKAKLLASSLKLAISVQKDKPMVYDIPQQHYDVDPLRSNIRVMLHHTGSDAHVITLNTKDEEETMSLKMSDNQLEVVQYIDGDEAVLTVPGAGNITNQQYLLEIERYGTVYNLTLTTSDGEQIEVDTNSLFKTPTAYTTEYQPTSLLIGGGDSLSTCFLGLQVNGYHVNWFKKKQTEDTLPTACQSQKRWLTYDSHLIYEEVSGFAMYDINRRRFKTFSISFNPRSPGTICVLNDKRYSLLVDVFIDDSHTLTVKVKYHSYIAKLISKITYGTDHTVKLTFKTGGKMRVEGTLNGQSNTFKTIIDVNYPWRNETNIRDKLYVGGLPGQNSTFVGCVKSASIDDTDVMFDMFEDAQDVTFGTCQTKNCVGFEADSQTVEMKDVSSVRVISLVVSRDATGPILQLSKNKKFSLTVSVSDDGVSLEETVQDNTDTIYVDDDAPNMVITIIDDAEDESIKVTVNDKSEELSYAVSVGWLFKKPAKSDDEAPSTYDITIGASTEEDDQFIGTISDFIIDGSPLNLLPYIEDNRLAGCQTAPKPTETKTEKIYPTMTCS